MRVIFRLLIKKTFPHQSERFKRVSSVSPPSACSKRSFQPNLQVNLSKSFSQNFPLPAQPLRRKPLQTKPSFCLIRKLLPQPNLQVNLSKSFSQNFPSPAQPLWRKSLQTKPAFCLIRKLLPQPNLWGNLSKTENLGSIENFPVPAAKISKTLFLQE